MVNASAASWLKDATPKIEVDRWHSIRQKPALQTEVRRNIYPLKLLAEDLNLEPSAKRFKPAWITLFIGQVVVKSGLAPIHDCNLIIIWISVVKPLI